MDPLVFTIRPTEDEELIRELDSVCLPGAEKSLDFDDASWWVVTCGGEPAGYCGIAPDHAWNDTGYLSRSGVLPGFRGHGLQRRMIGVRERYARKVGYNCCISDTASVYSANNLIQCGYKLYRPKEPWAWEHSWYFYKWMH
jgi:GNAT superfamily N-acetyltransferase